MTETLALAIAEMQRDCVQAELTHMDNLLRRIMREARGPQELISLIDRILASHAKDMMMTTEDRALCAQ
jgi:hypothetical protein